MKTKRDIQIEKHSYLVRITAQRLTRRSMAASQNALLSEEDLIGAGHIALIRAVDQFDPARGVKFATYAIALIRGAIREEMRQAPWAPRSVQEDAARIEAARGRIFAETGECGTPAMVAEALGISEDTLSGMEACADRQTPASLDGVLNHFSRYPGQDEECPTVADYGLLVDTDFAGDLIAKMRQEAAVSTLGELPARQALVIQKKYGLGEYEEMTFAAIADELGISESRVWQIFHDGMRKLQNNPALLEWI